MGSFNLNCAVTGLPIINDEAVIIPMFIKDSSRRNVYVYDNVRIFPFFAVGTYADYGAFEMNDDEMSNKTLDFVKNILISNTKSKSDEDDGEIDLSELNWEQFFELCHEDYTSGWGRLAFAAIEKKTFDTIISEYEIHSILDESVEGYDPKNYGYLGFEHYLQSTKKEYENKKLEFFSCFDIEDKNQPVSWFSLKPYVDFPVRFIETGVISLMRRSNDTKSLFLNDVEFENLAKILYLNYFFQGINKSWQESFYAGQETDLPAFKVFRNVVSNHILEQKISELDDLSPEYIDTDVITADKSFIKICTDTIDSFKRLKNIKK